ncbi:hypothetical protein PACTADRAFT_42382 [Pachysolen tannophilus NRRL Y-2460]|uniref:Uncharacterized protein n=1 Tax=Pachysolen tannophilus NRRL Y-2460 TaxID=669874 RepID=A0A1E4TV91_PACTA|nr:hypothetical protein PACTADRAFT_42382 [Pachysolen tannophilus NRRL Y-2460]
MLFKRLYSQILPRSGLINLNPLKSLILVTGKDAPYFLNGLTTSKLLPTFVKKNEYTISPDDEDKDKNKLELTEDQLTTENWGIINEDSFISEESDPAKIGIRRDGINSMILNSKGRVVTDLFIYPLPFNVSSQDLKLNDNKISTIELLKQPSYLLEINNSFLNKIFMMLKVHKLSSKVNIIKLQQQTTNNWYYFNENENFLKFLEVIEQNYFNNTISRDISYANKLVGNFINNELLFPKNLQLLSFAIDNRAPLTGIKFITSSITNTIKEENQVQKLFSNDFLSYINEKVILQPTEIYDIRRNIKGIPEVSDLKPNEETLPFESNIDLTNGISYDKGCYVGQELTIRTYFNGIIRKRIMPFQLFISEDEVSDEIQYNKNSPVVEYLKNENLIDGGEIITNDVAIVGKSTAASPFGSTIKRKKETPQRKLNVIGKIFKQNDNIGFAVVNLAFLQKINKKAAESDKERTNFFDFELNIKDNSEKKAFVRIFVPEYWPEDIIE